MVIGIGLTPSPPRSQAPVVIREDLPTYRITEEKGFFGPNDHLYKLGEMIYWTGEPSIGMEPLNTLARVAMKKYLAKLDDAGRKMAEKVGKHYTSLEDAFDNMFENSRVAEQQGGLISGIGGMKVVPLMGIQKKVTGIAPVVEDAQAPLLGTSRVPNMVEGQFDNDRSKMNSNTDPNRFI